MDRDDAAVMGELELHRRQPLWIWVLFGIAVLTTMVGVPLALVALSGPACIHGTVSPRWNEGLAALAPALVLWTFVVLGVRRLSDRGRVSWDAWGLYEWSVPGAAPRGRRSAVRTAIAWRDARAELE
ncbi:MAG: hypothetical protein M3Y87_28315, partial [Myxococcota bacterium]|nr:hypothetical protein [Myxococcota bacterium]